MVAAAIIGGIASAGAAVVTNRATSRASGAATRSAADTRAAADSTNTANNTLTREIYDANTRTLTPFITRGNAAGDKLADLTKTNPFMVDWSKFEASPDFALRIKEGNEALNSNLAAKGLLNSGKLIKSSVDYGQEQGSLEAQNWWARQQGSTQAYIDYLDGQQREGLGAASAVAGVGQNYAGTTSANNNAFLNTVANTNTQRSDAIGNAALAGAGTTAGLFGDLAGAYGTYRGLSSFQPKKR